MKFDQACISGNTDKVVELYNDNCNINVGFAVACQYGHLETAKKLLSMGVSVNGNYNSSFKWCYHKHPEIAKWLLSIDPTIISKTVRELYHKPDYDKIGIFKKSAVLFECIKFYLEFPPIDDIEDIVIISLAYYGMIDHLNKLKGQFPFINFDVK